MIALLVLMIVAGVLSQRSPYLGQPKEYPGLLPRFGTSNTNSNSANGSGNLGDRLGETPQVPGTLAEGTLNDRRTVDRVAAWPKDKQPFWYVNREHIAGHRGYRPNEQTGNVINPGTGNVQGNARRFF